MPVWNTSSIIVAVAIGGVMLASPGVPMTGQQNTPLEVTFSAPADGEADVRLDTVIRIQFSRHLDERSLANRVRVRYSAVESAERGEAQPPALRFDVKYDPGYNAIAITPARPLERFREVQVDLLDGILSADGSALKPWRLRFHTGGSD
jgi:hypothetical protein